MGVLKVKNRVQRENKINKPTTNKRGINTQKGMWDITNMGLHSLTTQKLYKRNKGLQGTQSGV